MIRQLFARVEFWILVGSVALLGVGIAVVYDPSPPPIHALERSPSTNHRSGYGLKALYLVLWRVGFEVKRVGDAADLHQGTSHLLFLVQPASRFGWDKKAANQLAEWVRGGGRAVFIPGDSAASDFAALGGALTGIELRQSGDESAGFEFAARGPEKRIAPKVIVKTLARLRIKGGSEVQVLLGDDAGAVALEVALGRGRVVVLSDPYLLSNAGLKNAGNASFVAALVARLAKSRAVLFDEVHHGFCGDRVDTGFWDVVTAGPGGSIVALIAMVFLVWAFSAGQRFGAAVRVIRTERRSSVEYVEAYAALLRRAERDGLAVWFIADAFRHEAARRLGCGRPPDDDGELARRFSTRWGGAAREVEAGLKAARHAPQQELRQADLFAAAKRIESYWKQMIESGRGRSR